MITPEELETLIREENIGVNYKTLDCKDISTYFERLNKRLSNLREILTRDSEKEDESGFVLPFLKVVGNSLNCLELKHKVTGDDMIDFPLSIVPINSGFPTVKDFALLERDKERAKRILGEEIPSRRKLIGAIRAGILGGRTIEHEQILLHRHNYFTAVETANLLPSLRVYSDGPQLCNLQEGKRLYTLDWHCFEGGLNAPVFYRMWFTQDANYPPLHDEGERKKDINPVLEEVIRQSRRGIENINELAIHLDRDIREIHPKQIKKYVIGPYADCLTSNSPELKMVFEGVKDASALRFSVEIVLSEKEKRRGINGVLDYLSVLTGGGEKLVREVYGGVKLMKYGLIVPMRVKQKLNRGSDENGDRCDVYGVTENGEVSL